MKGNIYPDLIRVFYTNLNFEGNNLVSCQGCGYGDHS